MEHLATAMTAGEGFHDVQDRTGDGAALTFSKERESIREYRLNVDYPLTGRSPPWGSGTGRNGSHAE